jgi:hypothetical protein
MIKINYSYTDEFGQETALIKTFDDCVLEDSEDIEILVNAFDDFISSCG